MAPAHGRDRADAAARASAGFAAAPEDGRAAPFFATGASVGYHTAIEWSFVAGAFRELGPATVWLRTHVALVAGEEPSPLARVLIAADSGNGVSATLDFLRHRFVNVDLSVHLHRLPAGEWVCLDARDPPPAERDRGGRRRPVGRARPARALASDAAGRAPPGLSRGRSGR